MSSDLVPLPEDLPAVLERYLPHIDGDADSLPFVTLTYAQSVDSKIAAKPGTRTHISHAETNTMTHYLRTFHDAILVGVSTVLADDPSLNCRYDGHCVGSSSSIRPVVLDPRFRLADAFQRLKLVQNYRSGKGMKPIIVMSTETPVSADGLSEVADIVRLPTSQGVFSWIELLHALKNDYHIGSVMVEGGAHIINTLLNEIHPATGAALVDSLIVTIGPVYLGQDGVNVSPASPVILKSVKWWTGVQDSVMCATLK